MMYVADVPLSSKLTNIAGPALLLQSTTKSSTLPQAYQPHSRDICCGRGKRNWTHAGNIYFRQLIQANVDRYIEAPTSRDKTKAVLSIVDYLRQEGSYFVKQDNSGSWYDIGDSQARTKVGHSFRDQITAMKKVEKKNDTTTAITTPASAPVRNATPAVANYIPAPAAVSLANPPMLKSIDTTSSEVAAASRGIPMPMASGLSVLLSLNYPQASNFAQQGAPNTQSSGITPQQTNSNPYGYETHDHYPNSQKHHEHQLDNMQPLRTFPNPLPARLQHYSSEPVQNCFSRPSVSLSDHSG